VSGATTGDAAPAELSHVFFRQIAVLGSTMGTREELEQLAAFVTESGVQPLIEETMPLGDARRGFEALAGGDLFGKVVLIP
jgi:D-arabinose 1-dehydrogenase-like Zn-dependent alcohol dehydrogenase